MGLLANVGAGQAGKVDARTSTEIILSPASSVSTVPHLQTRLEAAPAVFSLRFRPQLCNVQGCLGRELEQDEANAKRPNLFHNFYTIITWEHTKGLTDFNKAF